VRGVTHRFVERIESAAPCDEHNSLGCASVFHLKGVRGTIGSDLWWILAIS